MTALEALNTLLRGWNVPAPEVTSSLAAAREQSLLYGEHTWGGAFYWVTKYGADVKWSYGSSWQADRAAGRFQKLEASWAEHTGYIEKARDLTRPLLADTLQTLARAVNVDGRRVVVFNPLPWKRDGLVRVPAPAGAAIKYLMGAEGPTHGGLCVAVAHDGDQLVFPVHGVPANGYQTLVPVDADGPSEPSQIEAHGNVIQSASFTVTLDPAHGGIASLMDRRTGRELIDRTSEHAFGQYLYERFDADQVKSYTDAYLKQKTDWAVAELGKPKLPSAKDAPHREGSPRDMSLRIETSPVAAVAVMESKPSEAVPHAVTTRVLLPAGQPYVDLEITLHNKAADNWPEAGWVCLPVQAEAPRFRLGRLGGIADPAPTSSGVRIATCRP